MADQEILPPPPPPPPVPPPLPAQYTMFRGPSGIRAGWRVLIFVALVAAVGVALGIAFALLVLLRKGRAGSGFQASALTPLGLSLTEGAIFLCTAVAALIMAKIEHRQFGQYGLPVRPAFGQHFWMGTLAGFLAISACLLGIFAFHGFRLTGMAIHGSTIVAATLAWGLTFILVGLAEEFCFRGYLQFTLTTGMGFWPSAFVLSALFGLAHAGNPGESKSGLFSVVIFGLLFCLFLRRTGNLWWAVGFHAGWDCLGPDILLRRRRQRHPALSQSLDGGSAAIHQSETNFSSRRPNRPNACRLTSEVRGARPKVRFPVLHFSFIHPWRLPEFVPPCLKRKSPPRGRVSSARLTALFMIAKLCAGFSTRDSSAMSGSPSMGSRS